MLLLASHNIIIDFTFIGGGLNYSYTSDYKAVIFFEVDLGKAARC